MARIARVKVPDAVYHVISRSISELLLFRDNDDKDYYLGLLKKYIDKFCCSVYSYCLMDTHVHIQLDPKGFDISKFMLCLNTSYVRYYNKKYNRHGPLFQGRFTSRICLNDRYALALSAYIHNNPKDIIGFSGKEEFYLYSSYGIYLGIRNDKYRLVDTNFIMCLFNSRQGSSLRFEYYEFVSCQRDIDFESSSYKDLFSPVESIEYIRARHTIIRNINPDKVIAYITDKLSLPSKYSISVKSNRKLMEYRSFIVYVLRVLGGLSYKDICSKMYNITLSGCAYLFNKGSSLLNNNESTYTSLFDDIISLESA